MIAGIVCYNDGVLYYFNVCLKFTFPEMKIPGIVEAVVDISGCQNCDMHVSTEQLVYR